MPNSNFQLPNCIVCAAARVKIDTSSYVIASPRHFDTLFHKNNLIFIPGLLSKHQTFTVDQIHKAFIESEQGFIDRHGKFHTREAAWKIAESADQIRRRVGGDRQNGGTLYSENLY